MPEVRLIDEQSEQRGVMKIDDALRFAQERDLDLVEVAPEAKPPVVRVLDYSKYKYEQAQKQKQARKHQQQITIREIKLRPKIAQHDYETKKGHVERFLRHKDKVKITIMFRGREVTHPERGIQLLDRIADELAEYGVVEQRPLHEGRNMTMMLGPSKAVLSGHFDKGAERIGQRRSARGGVVDAAPSRPAPTGAGPTADVVPAPEPVAEPVPEPAASVADPVPDLRQRRRPVPKPKNAPTRQPNRPRRRAKKPAARTHGEHQGGERQGSAQSRRAPSRRPSRRPSRQRSLALPPRRPKPTSDS